MSAANYNILIEQGADFSLPCQLKDPAGAVIPITGATITSKLRLQAQDPNVLAVFTVTLDDAANGKFTISLTGTQTAAIPTEPSGGGVRKITTASYDVNITYAGGQKERLLQGVAEISPQVTR